MFHFSLYGTFTFAQRSDCSRIARQGCRTPAFCLASAGSQGTGFALRRDVAYRYHLFELELKGPEVSSACPANFGSSSEQLKQSAQKSAFRAATDYPCGISVQSPARKALLLFLGGTETPSTLVGILAHAIFCTTVWWQVRTACGTTCPCRSAVLFQNQLACSHFFEQ